LSYRSKEYFVVDRQTSADKPLSQDGYTVFNANVTYIAPDDKLRIAGYIDNFTDKLYQVYGRPNGAGAGNYVITYGNPRTFGVSLTLNY